MTGTAAEVTPVREIDDRQIGSGRPGPITQELQRRFQAVTRGEDPDVSPLADAGWLSLLQAARLRFFLGILVDTIRPRRL